MSEEQIRVQAKIIGDRPAFPFPGIPTDGTDVPWEVPPHPGMTYRQWLEGMVANAAMALDSEDTVADVSKELGIPVTEYRYKIHWPMIVALRVRGQVQAMLELQARREVES